MFQLYNTDDHEPLNKIIVFNEPVTVERMQELRDIYKSDHETYSAEEFVDFLNEQRNTEAELQEPTGIWF